MASCNEKLGAPADIKHVADMWTLADIKPVDDMTTPADIKPVADMWTPADIKPVDDMTTPADIKPVADIWTPADIKPVADIRAPADIKPGDSLCDNPACLNNDASGFGGGFCVILAPDVDMVTDYIECRRCGECTGERDWRVKHERQVAALQHANTSTLDLFERQLSQDVDTDVTHGGAGDGLSSSSSSSSSSVTPFRGDEEEGMSDGKLQQARNVIFQQPCVCGNISPGRFQNVQSASGEVISNLKHCLDCGECIGADDTMSFYDLENFLSNCELKTSPCRNCGNDDPYLFVFEDSSYGETMRCCRCKSLMVHDSQEMNTSEHSDSHRDTQCKCGGSSQSEPPLLVHVTKDGRTHMVECEGCGRRESLWSCVECGNKDPQSLCGFYNEDCSLRQVTCLLCSRRLQNLEDISECENKHQAAAGRTQCPKTKIWSLRMLQKGDHVAWHQPLGYWHHALVVKVDRHQHQLLVIEYDGPTYEKRSIQGEIVEHWKPVNPQKEQMYRIDYQPGETVPVDEVLENARRRIGEKRYNLLGNNCEHFARGCKTGTRSCTQTNSLKNTLLCLGAGFVGMLANRTADVVGGLTGGAGVSVAKEAGMAPVAAAAKVSSCAGLEALGTVAVVVVEAGFLIKDIREAHKLWKERGISKEVFINMVIKRSAQSACAVAGASAGSVLGSLAIPVPVLGGMVGSTLGAILGHLLGPAIGRQLVLLKDFMVKHNRQRRKARRIQCRK